MISDLHFASAANKKIENGVKSTIDPWKIKCYMLQHVTST